MKVLLLANIKGVGSKGDLKEVPEGYFRNMLLPQRLAVPATDAAVSHLKAQQAKTVEKLDKIKESAVLVQKKIEGQEITISAKAHDEEKLYAAVHERQIVEAIKAQLKVELPESAVELEEAIKSVGVFPIKLKLYQGLYAQLTLRVTAQ